MSTIQRLAGPGVITLAALAASACTAPAATGAAATVTAAHTTVALRAGQAGTRAQVPWRQVGQGWTLAEYSSSTPPGVIPHKAGPATLYLVSPEGVRYRLYQWSARGPAPALVDWSGDKTRALLVRYPQGNGPLQVEQITLATGRLTTLFRMPITVTILGYTRPRGLNVLASAGNGTMIARYDLHGQLQAVLARGSGVAALQSPDGRTLAVSWSRGLVIVSNADGHVIRSLAVDRGQAGACYPDQWWDAVTVVADCVKNGYGQTWLVTAAGGGTPVAITPRRDGHGADPTGDVGAWELRSGLYLQAIGPCSALYIVKQLHGSVRAVNIPGTTGNNNHVLTAYRSGLLVRAQTGCPGSDSLLWFNPGTGDVRMLLRASGEVAGVISAVPYGRLSG